MVYGTMDRNHPYVDRVLGNTNVHYIGGTLQKVSMPKHYDFNVRRLDPTLGNANNNWDTDLQADKFFPRMKVHRENMEKIDIELRDAAKDILRKIEDGKEISDSELNKMLENATDLERQKIDEKTRFMNGLNGILDNTQRVKLTMFKTKFAKDMQEQIRIKRKMMAK